MKVKVTDMKRWLIKVIVSMGIWFIIGLIVLQLFDVNESQDTFILIFVVSFAIVIGYWVYAYKTTTIILPIDEFLEKNPNIVPNYLRNLLLKQGYAKEEVSKVVRNNTIVYDKGHNDNENVDNEVWEDDFSNKMGAKTKAKLIGFIISLIIGIFLGIAGTSFAGGLVCTLMACIVIIPIASIIGSTKELNNKIKTNLPLVFNELKEQGINIEEKYISNIGNGIIIDRTAEVVAVVTAQTNKPFVVPFTNISGCELMEEITEKIGNANIGYAGMLTGNKGLKELGHYDSRKVEQFYRQLGITIILKENGRTARMDVPFINGEINTWAVGNLKKLALEAVSNVNSVISYSNDNDNMKEILEKAKVLKKQGNLIVKNKEITDKMKEMKKKLTKEEIDFFVGEEDDVYPISYEERQEWIKENNVDLKNFKSIISTETEDYDKIIKLIDRQNQLLEKEEFKRSDWANYYNYMVDTRKIVEKYEKR